MIIGKVVGSVVSTRKSEKLVGNKFMIVEPVHHMKGDLSQIVAIDIIGAGIGEVCIGGTGKRSKNRLRRRNSTGGCSYCRYCRRWCGIGVTPWKLKSYRKLFKRMV